MHKMKGENLLAASCAFQVHFGHNSITFHNNSLTYCVGKNLKSYVKKYEIFIRESSNVEINLECGWFLSKCDLQPLGCRVSSAPAHRAPAGPPAPAASASWPVCECSAPSLETWDCLDLDNTREFHIFKMKNTSSFL